jgi:hypothetical protein
MRWSNSSEGRSGGGGLRRSPRPILACTTTAALLLLHAPRCCLLLQMLLLLLLPRACGCEHRACMAGPAARNMHNVWLCGELRGRNRAKR